MSDGEIEKQIERQIDLQTKHVCHRDKWKWEWVDYWGKVWWKRNTDSWKDVGTLHK